MESYQRDLYIKRNLGVEVDETDRPWTAFFGDYIKKPF